MLVSGCGRSGGGWADGWADGWAGGCCLSTVVLVQPLTKTFCVFFLNLVGDDVIRSPTNTADTPDTPTQSDDGGGLDDEFDGDAQETTVPHLIGAGL